MGWDDGDKNNPWQPKRGDKGPADLDAIVKDLKRKLAGLLGGRGGGQGPGGRSISGGAIAAVVVLLLAIWAATGIYTVDAAEQAIVLRFGAYRGTMPPGLHWHLPWPIEQADIVNTGATERWQYQGSMLTSDENIVDIDLVVQYRRTDPKSYLFSLRDPEVTLRDVTASAIREVVGKNKLDFILTNGRSDIATQTQKLLQSTLDSYHSGINIYAVNLQKANFPQQVESAVQDAVKAKEDRARRVLEAQAYENGLLPKARGEAARRRQDAEAYRSQQVADAQGESDRFLALMAQYKKAPKVTRERMYLSTLETVLANSKKVLVNTGAGNNVLYLPLDQLMKQRQQAGGTGGSAAPGASQGSSSGSASSTGTNGSSSGARARTSR
jgi:membrane protease subunit HflK